MSDYIPKWYRELEIFSKIKPVLILEGNILDKYQYPVESSIQKGSILTLTEHLHYHLKDCGYSNIVFYDSIQGFYNKCESGYIQKFAEMLDVELNDEQHIESDFKGRNSTACRYIKRAVTQNKIPTAIILNLASRYISSPEHMEQSETDSFTVLLQASLESRDVKTENGTLKNIVIILVNKANDIPAWFYLDNPNVKTILLPSPSREEREQLIKGNNFSSFFSSDIYKQDIQYYTENHSELEKIQDRFTALTEGFTFTELNGLRRLCKNQKIHIKDMCSIIDLYKFGIKENPWSTLDYSEIRNAYSDFEKRVKGQQNAVVKTLDVIKRAVTGLNGLQHSSHSKPKGILFFAGPTGTGKTETAKTLAEKLFGDEKCCIRFDMSEYSQPHSDQKLLGAPPGYVGYEAGGQLTNAVKNNPFSILLFDEIEKANPSILDKFLQILEDGRMTDGQGNTVYFSETIIIFTSNLGIYSVNENNQRVLNVTPDMPYDEVQKTVRKGVEDYFKTQLGRPEILNRIGENIIVFDFIREDTAQDILKSQIQKITNNLKAEKNISLTLSGTAFEKLRNKSLGNLENGGRGIGNIVESCLINPLARYLFDNNIFENTVLEITDIDTENFPYSISGAIS